MNSWKITESNGKKNEHLLPKFLLSPPVFRAYTIAVGRYRGRWDPTVSCAVLAESTEQGLFPRGRGRKQLLYGEQLKDSRRILTHRDHMAEMRNITDKSVFVPNNAATNSKILLALFVRSGCLWSCQWGGFETRLHSVACSTVQLLLLLRSLPTWVSVWESKSFPSYLDGNSGYSLDPKAQWIGLGVGSSPTCGIK